MLYLWDVPCPMELSTEVVSCLGPVAAMELRCVSRPLLELVSHRLLLQCAAESWRRPEQMPLCELVRNAKSIGDPHAVAVLTTPAGSALDETNTCGQTALMWAAGHGCAPLCRLLLEQGANMEAVDSGGWTALFRACWHGRSSAVSVLIRRGANLDCRAAKYTPLMAAARFGHHGVVERLLLAGADSAQTTVFGETALSLALHSHHQAVVALLRGELPQAATDVEQGASFIQLGAGWEMKEIQAMISAHCRRHMTGAIGRREAQRAFDQAAAGLRV